MIAQRGLVIVFPFLFSFSALCSISRKSFSREAVSVIAKNLASLAILSSVISSTKMSFIVLSSRKISDERKETSDACYAASAFGENVVFEFLVIDTLSF